MIAALLIPIGIVLMVWVASRIFETCWDRNLTVDLTFGMDHAVVGDETVIRQRVANSKLLPVLVLQVAYQTDRGLAIESGSKVSVSDHVNVVEVFSMRPYEEAVRDLRVRCERRGYYQIQRVSLTAWHFLGRGSLYANMEQNSSLYVYPERVDPGTLFMVIDRLSGDLRTRSVLYEDPFAFRGIRNYTPQDPMNRINWKASARTGDLMVNLRDYTSGQRVLLLLNLEDPATAFADDLLEDGIRLAAAIAGRLVQHQIPVSFATNGRDCVTGQSPVLAAGSSYGHLQSILEILTRLNIHAGVSPFEEILETRRLQADTAQESCCIISSARRDTIAGLAENLGIAQGGILWVCPLLAQEEDKAVGPHIEFVRLNHEELIRQV